MTGAPASRVADLTLSLLQSNIEALVVLHVIQLISSKVFVPTAFTQGPGIHARPVLEFVTSRRSLLHKPGLRRATGHSHGRPPILP